MATYIQDFRAGFAEGIRPFRRALPMLLTGAGLLTLGTLLLVAFDLGGYPWPGRLGFVLGAVGGGLCLLAAWGRIIVAVLQGGNRNSANRMRREEHDPHA